MCTSRSTWFSRVKWQHQIEKRKRWMCQVKNKKVKCETQGCLLPCKTWKLRTWNMKRATAKIENNCRQKWKQQPWNVKSPKCENSHKCENIFREHENRSFRRQPEFWLKSTKFQRNALSVWRGSSWDQLSKFSWTLGCDWKSLRERSVLYFCILLEFGENQASSMTICRRFSNNNYYKYLKVPASSDLLTMYYRYKQVWPKLLSRLHIIISSIIDFIVRNSFLNASPPLFLYFCGRHCTLNGRWNTCTCLYIVWSHPRHLRRKALNR